MLLKNRYEYNPLEVFKQPLHYSINEIKLSALDISEYEGGLRARKTINGKCVKGCKILTTLIYINMVCNVRLYK